MAVKRLIRFLFLASFFVLALSGCKPNPAPDNRPDVVDPVEKSEPTLRLVNETGDGDKDTESVWKYPLYVAVWPGKDAKLQEVYFSFTSNERGRKKVTVGPVQVMKDTAAQDIAGRKEKAMIVIQRNKAPMDGVDGRRIFEFEAGDFVFTAKNDHGEKTTMTVHVENPSGWLYSHTATIRNIQHGDSCVLNLMTGDVMSLSGSPESLRYVMNSSETTQFRPAFTSQSVTVDGDSYKGNETLFYKVQLSDPITYQSSTSEIYANLTKIIGNFAPSVSDLVANDLVLGYHENGKDREIFLINIDDVQPEAGDGQHKGQITLTWKVYIYRPK